MRVGRKFQHLNRNGMTRMNLTLHIKNFGPISDAKLSLRPLTVFIGPNNSGKSYAAMLIHSIVSAYKRDNFYYVPRHLPDSSARLQDGFVAILRKIHQLKPRKKRTVIPDSLVNEIAKSYFERNSNHILPNRIRYNFATKLDDLVRIGETSFSIRSLNPDQTHVTYENSQWSSNFQIPKLKMQMEVDDEMTGAVRASSEADGSTVFTIGTRLSSLFDEIPMSMVGDELLAAICDKIFQNFPPQSYYLPAARSGIMLSHRSLTASIIQHAPYAGIKGTQIPPLSGVVADFLSVMTDMPSHKGVFYKQAESLEASILNGQIYKAVEKYRLPEIKYKFLNQEIPLHNASSTVSEIAPLILYLRHIVDEGSLLIIEEPEAHLHPANQVILARHIAKMIRSGLNVLITTHSQPLLEQLSLLLQASKADQNIRKDMGLSPDEFLRENEVSPYLFIQTAPGNHAAEPIECSGDEGISQEEFVKVQDELYNQTICVEQGFTWPPA